MGEWIKRCTHCKYWKLKGDIEPCKSCDDELSNFKEKEKATGEMAKSK